MDIKIADLRHRITFQSLTRTPDDQGGYTAAWVDFSTVWAKIAPASGLEVVHAQQLEQNYDHEIIIRNLVGINSSMRVSFDGRIFQIRSIAREDERRWWMKIKVKEGVAS